MRRRRPRRGFALMLVVVYTSMTLSAWSLAARRGADLVRLKESLKRREEAALARPERCRLMALAYGLALLETGQPPPDLMEEGQYRCNVAIGLPNAGAVTYTLTFRPVEGGDEWTVRAEIAEDLSLPGPGGFSNP